MSCMCLLPQAHNGHITAAAHFALVCGLVHLKLITHSAFTFVAIL